MSQLLEGQTIVVTGAGRGWGASIARMLARHGALVVLTSEVSDELAETARLIYDEGGRADAIVADLSDPGETERFAAEVVARHGRVTTLVNNAAILRNTPLLEQSQAQVEQAIAVMLLAPMRLSRAFLPAMIKAGRGSIINVSSRAGREAFGGEVDYCAAKFGLEGFSLALADELRQHNISVNLVTPGRDIGDRPIKPTSVTAFEFARWPPERRARYRDSMELSEAFVYLAMQDAASLTGRRFSASALSARLRERGFDLTPDDLANIPDE